MDNNGACGVCSVAHDWPLLVFSPESHSYQLTITMLPARSKRDGGGTPSLAARGCCFHFLNLTSGHAVAKLAHDLAKKRALFAKSKGKN